MFRVLLLLGLGIGTLVFVGLVASMSTNPVKQTVYPEVGIEDLVRGSSALNSALELRGAVMLKPITEDKIDNFRREFEGEQQILAQVDRLEEIQREIERTAGAVRGSDGYGRLYLAFKRLDALVAESGQKGEDAR